jgi:RHS repeat-associated protein
MIVEGSQSYTYDGAGRITVFGANSGVYRYDALGRRIMKTYIYQSQSGTVSGSIISIYGSGNALLVDYKTETGPEGNNNSRTNYVVNNGIAIAIRTIPESGSATTKYLHRNHLGQVVDPVDLTTGYGVSSMYSQPYSSGGDEQFPGHKDDPESGLHYNLARSYDPRMSRWISADKVMPNAYDPQSLNKYSYNRNDPVNLLDPSGNSPWSSEMGGSSTVCTVDGIDVDCGLAASLLGSGAGVQIPFGMPTTYYDYDEKSYRVLMAGAGGTVGYVNVSDLEEMHEWNGRFLTNSEFYEVQVTLPAFLQQMNLAAEQLAKTLGISKDEAMKMLNTNTKSDNRPVLKGGNWNFFIDFKTAAQIGDVLGNSGRASGSPSLHMRESSQGAYIHVDTSNPWLDVAGLMGHGIVDVFVGTVFYGGTGIPR